MTATQQRWALSRAGNFWHRIGTDGRSLCYGGLALSPGRTFRNEDFRQSEPYQGRKCIPCRMKDEQNSSCGNCGGTGEVATPRTCGRCGGSGREVQS